MDHLKSLVVAGSLLTGLAFSQVVGPVGGGGQASGSKRPVAPTAGIDLSSMNAAQRTLQVVMVRVQLAGILGEETVPTSRAIVIGMNYVMRISLTPEQQKLIDAQVWRRPGSSLGEKKEWHRVLNSGSHVSSLARLSSQQEQTIGQVYRRCSVNWDAFRRAGGESAGPARRMAIMWEQQEGSLREVRTHLTAPQRAEWDRLVATFLAEMRAAVGNRP